MISIVVCTYNRSALLADLLHTLGEQTLPPADYEIIVVDNNSTDDTHAVVAGLQKRIRNIRYCLESRQGLSHARNHGWQTARGTYVAYMDDDCKAPPHWAAAAQTIAEQVAPAVFGGPHFAFYNTPKPRWFKDSYESHTHGDAARPLTPNEYLNGMNIVFRKSVLRQIGGFKPELGMSGNKIAYGEETDLVQRIHTTLPDECVYYDPDLFVYHLVRADKMTLRWIIRHHISIGRYAYRVFGADSPFAAPPGQLLWQTIRAPLALAGHLVAAFLWRDRKKYSYVQNYLYERAFKRLQALGSLYEQCRRDRDRGER